MTSLKHSFIKGQQMTNVLEKTGTNLFCKNGHIFLYVAEFYQLLILYKIMSSKTTGSYIARIYRLKPNKNYKTSSIT